MPQDVRKVGDLHAAVLAGWEQQAAFFDSQLGDEGGDWERALIGPVVERLLALPAGAQLLELACGNGVFARRMAARGIRVTATDLSPEMVRRAEGRATDGITYAVADANDAAALQALSAEPFDAAVCNMAVMSMPEVAPMYNGVIGLLKPGAPFVVSTLHPAFATTLPQVGEETVEAPNGPQQLQTIRLWRYKQPFTTHGVAMIGQTEKQFYFHRPLEYILVEAFEAGWTLDALEEPVLPRGDSDRPRFMWETLPDIPPVLVVRFRKP